MEEIIRKSYSGVDIEWNAEKAGAFRAKIAELNVIDKDGDVTLPGAMPAGKAILISAYMHGSWDGALPVGKGVIEVVNNDVIVDGQFNLKTVTGKEHYETLKFSPELSEWSYGFRVLEVAENTEWSKNPGVWRVFAKLDVFEASPVLRGAGVNTGLLSIKSEKTGLTYAEQADAVLAAAGDLVVRTKSLADLRRSEGRDLSPAAVERVLKLREAFDGLAGELGAVVKADPGKPEAEELTEEIRQYLAGLRAYRAL